MLKSIVILFILFLLPNYSYAQSCQRETLYSEGFVRPGTDTYITLANSLNTMQIVRIGWKFEDALQIAWFDVEVPPMGRYVIPVSQWISNGGVQRNFMTIIRFPQFGKGTLVMWINGFPYAPPPSPDYVVCR